MQSLKKRQTGRFNRNIVECKFGKLDIEIQELKDLIETQWNVNEEPPVDNACATLDLIETQWNVNAYKIRLYDIDTEI